MKKILIIGLLIVAGIFIYQNYQKTTSPLETPVSESNTATHTKDTSLALSELSIAGDLVVNTEMTELRWEGTAPLKSHDGTINAKEGELFVGSENITGIVYFDMNTIASEAGQGLDGHLKSADFFDVENHPQSSIEVINVVDGMMAGILTIKDIQQEITIPVNISEQNSFLVLESTFEINRLDWGIEYNSRSILGDIGDSIVNDEISIRVALFAEKNGE